MALFKRPLFFLLLVTLPFYPISWIVFSLLTVDHFSLDLSFSWLTDLLAQERLPLILFWVPFYFLIVKHLYPLFSGKRFKDLLRIAFPRAGWFRHEALFGLRQGAIISLGWVLLSILNKGVGYSSGLLSGIWFVSLLACLGWVITDELCFRMIIPSMLKAKGTSTRLLLGSLAFTISRAIVLPFSFFGLVGTFFLGITLAYQVERWKSLWVPITFHFTLLFIWTWLFGLPIGSLPLTSLLATYDLPPFWGDFYGPLASPVGWFLILSIPTIFEIQRISSSSILLWITRLLGGKTCQN